MTNITLSKPESTDGLSVHRLIESCPPLDSNSAYCNLLQCTHFAETSVIAKRNGETVGFISAYLKPEASNTLFVWQVAVSKKARGTGLAKKMLGSLLRREACKFVSHLETTITRDNKASWALFESFAKLNDAHLSDSTLFDCQAHFEGEHKSEELVRIGPIKRSPNVASMTDFAERAQTRS